MKMNNSSVAILLAVIVVAGCNSTKESRAKDVPTAIEHAAEKIIKKPLIHSTSIGVVYQGNEFVRHSGELEKGKSNPPSNDTIYEIGSLSKTFAGTLLAKAVLEKRVDVEDEVQKYLPEHYPNLQYKDQPIRVKHLLSHSSGLPNMLPLRMNEILQDFTNHSTPGKISETYRHYGQSDFLKDLHDVEINASPGHKYSYSSVGTELTACILEAIYKTSYEALLADYLSNNIGMKSTGLRLSAKEMDRLAVGYHSDNSAITAVMPQLPWGASGNMKATVPDMMKYLKFQLGSDKVVMESHRTLVKFDDEFSLGYFWKIGTNDKRLGTYYSHHGGVPRSQCYIYIVPKYDLGVFIITNQSGEKTAALMKEALAEVFDTVAAIHKN